MDYAQKVNRLILLLTAVSDDLDKYLEAPDEYTSEYFESVSLCADEAKEIAISLEKGRL